MRARALVAAAVVSLIAAGCGGGDDDEARTRRTTTTPAPPPSTIPANIAPLTGLPADPAKLARPALIVKLDNAPKAHPQAGINQADLIVEEGVEGGITRFATVFHSGDSDPVGPVRSARSSDLAVAAPLNRPLFAYSGTNHVFQELLNRSTLVNVGVDVFAGGYRRQPGRPAPYNLFSSTSSLFGRAPAGAPPPPPQFSFRAEGEPLTGGVPAGGAHVEFRGRVVTLIDWTWDPGARAWKRQNNGTVHVDTAGRQLAPRNVIIAFVTYKDTGFRDQSGEPVPEAEFQGEGEAWILTEGQVVKGKWRKPAPEAVAQFVDAAGQVVKLSPGQTFVQMPKPGMAQLR